MGKLVVVFKREFVERVRSRWFLVATLLGPVFFGLITVMPIVLAAKTRASTQLSNVIVIDATGTGLGARVVDALIETTPRAPRPRLHVVRAEEIAAAEEKATQAVVRNEALGFVVLDAKTTAGKEMKYAGRNAGALIDVEAIERLVRQSVLAVRLEREGLNPARVAMLTAVQLDTRTEKITDRGREAGGGVSNVVFGYGITLVLYMMIAIYGQGIMRGVLEEKTTRVAEVVVSSVKSDTLLAGKVLGSGLAAITQVSVWLVMSYVLYTLRGPILGHFGIPGTGAGLAIPSIPIHVAIALILFFVLGFIFYASLFAAVGAMISNQEDVQSASMPVTLLLVSCIIFMQPILLNPSSDLAQWMSWLPFSAPLMMPLRMSLIAVPWYEVVGSILSVAAGCWLAMWASARIYRVGLLMYGKKPTWNELARWIRMA